MKFSITSLIILLAALTQLHAAFPFVVIESDGGDTIETERTPVVVERPSLPEQIEGFEFDWALSPKSQQQEFGTIVLRQRIGEGKMAGVEASPICTECEEFGISPRLIQVDDTRWKLNMEVTDPGKLKPSINGRRLDVAISMVGRGGAVGFGMVSVTVRIESPQYLGSPDATGEGDAAGSTNSDGESDSEK